MWRFWWFPDKTNTLFTYFFDWMNEIFIPIKSKWWNHRPLCMYSGTHLNHGACWIQTPSPPCSLGISFSCHGGVVEVGIEGCVEYSGGCRGSWGQRRGHNRCPRKGRGGRGATRWDFPWGARPIFFWRYLFIYLCAKWRYLNVLIL